MCIYCFFSAAPKNLHSVIAPVIMSGIKEEPIDDVVATTSAEQHQLIKREEPIDGAVASTSAEPHQLIKREDIIDIKEEPLINEGDDSSMKLVSYCLFLTVISCLHDPLKA
jgi:hypothetical protein